MFLINYGNILLNLSTIERNIDFDFNEESPLTWTNDINFTKILKTDDIKEKILKSFIIGRPNNYAIKLDSNNNYYNLYSNLIKGYIESASAPDIIFYYNYENDNGKIKLNLINNINLDYFICCHPHIFNKNVFTKIKKDVMINKELKEIKTFMQINGSNYDYIINYINNNSINKSVWEINEFPNINSYLKKFN